MNKSPNRSLIKECDGLIQAIACLGKCVLSAGFRQAQVGHHLIGRSNMYYRHDLRNIVPLTDFHHTGDSPQCAELRPKAFANAMEHFYREQWEWAQAHRNEYHKAPDEESLLATRTKLRAFLAEGKPWTWADARILQEKTDG